MSRRVAALQSELGCRLFERTTRSVRLTSEGQRLADGARPLLVELESLVEDIISAGAEPRGRVRAAAPVGLGRELISNFLVALRGALPEIRLEVIATVGGEVDLIGDALDLAVVEGPLPDSSWRRLLLFKGEAVRDALTSGELMEVLPDVREPRDYYAVFAHADPPLRVRAVLEFTRDYVVSLFGG